MHPVVNEIQYCSNYIDSKIFFLRTTGQKKKKLQKTSFSEVFQFCSNEVARRFQRGDNIVTNSKLHGQKKSFLLIHQVNLNTSDHKVCINKSENILKPKHSNLFRQNHLSNFIILFFSSRNQRYYLIISPF